MSKYQNEIDAAAGALKDRGQQLTLRIFSHGSDPDEPWKPAVATHTDTLVHGVFFRYSEELVDGSEIHKEDQKVLIPAKGLPLAPDVNGHILRGAEVWKIVKVRTLNPAGDPILHTIQVRK